MQKTIALIATLDTKSREAEYIRERILAQGKNALIIDAGILGKPQEITPDYANDQVADLSGYALSQIKQASSRSEGLSIMARGIKNLLCKLHKEKKIDGVICIAGSGSVLSTPGMQALPLGFPKLLVSPLLSGERAFEPYVGTSDMMLMHSVVDILGINDVSKKIFDNAASAIVGMVDNADSSKLLADNLIAVTMFGQTTPGVMVIKEEIEKNGYQAVIFHANGVGGRCMEKLIEEKAFVGILDYTLSEITQEELGGLIKSTPTRMEIAGKHGIPQIIVPGCIDFLDIHPSNINKKKYMGRKSYSHSSEFTLVRTTKNELIKIAEVFARKLNAAKGPVEVIYPKQGLSAANKRGRELHDPESDNAFISTLKGKLNYQIPIFEKDSHINDSTFARFAANRLIMLIENLHTGNKVK